MSLVKSVKHGIFLWLSSVLMVGQLAHGNATPETTIEDAIVQVLDEFEANRASLEADKKALYGLVDELASPLFDFNYISKLVLAKSWKAASEDQRARFATEFKRLLIVTYATALFKYTGEEKMEFSGTKIKERKGKRFATVDSQVMLAEGSPIPVKYNMIQDPKRDEAWRIYNLSVGSLNMALNYRKVIQASISSEGLEGVIASMKENNDKNF